MKPIDELKNRMLNFRYIAFPFAVIGLLMMAAFSIAPLNAQDQDKDGDTYMTYLSGFNQIGLLYRLDVASGKSSLVTQGVMQTYEWSPDGNHIAVGDGYSIFVMDADGTNLRTIAEGVYYKLTETHYLAPAWSPDGSRLAFIEYGPRGQVDIVDPSDPEHRIKLDAPVINPPVYWSPDSDGMAFYQVGAPDAVFTLVKGLRDCVPLAGACSYASYNFSGYIAGWSPDNKQLAIMSGPPCCTLVIRDIDLDTPGCAESGKRNCAIVPSSRNIITDRSTTLNTTMLVESLQGWSADGRSMLFISNRSGTKQIYLVDTSSGDTRQLTDSPASKSEARWSPDGEHILFVEYEPDKPTYGSIRLMNADGSDARVLTEIDAPVWDIQWRPVKE